MNKSQLQQLIREEVRSILGKESVNEVKKDKYGNHLEPQFKKGDKVTYLGNKGVITGVNKGPSGVYSYSVSYDKGSGRTKASNISNKGGEIKNESVNEDKSIKNRFLGIFGSGKNTFQRKIRKVSSSEIKKLIQYTESNGDEVERIGKNSWGITKESGKDNQAVWQYLDGVLYFENPNYSSVYDTYIRKELKKSINEASQLQRIFRKIGWLGDDWTPNDYAKEIKNLPDSTLKMWYDSAKNNKGIPNTPLAFQQKLTKMEMEKRGLLGNESVNEDLGTIALGVMGGIGLYKILKFALKKVGVAVGSRVPLPKESLHNIINETNKALINNFIKGDKTLNMMQIALLTKVLKDYVDDGTIKNAKDIQAYSERAIKAMVKNDSSLNEDQEFLRARDEIENDKNKAKKLANLMAPGDDMVQQAAQFGPYEVLQVGADAIGSGSEDMYAYDGVFTQYDFMLMFKKAGYSNEAIEILMDDDYVQRLERG